MKYRYSYYLLIGFLVISACAPTRGFIVGALGGPQIVDEEVQRQYNEESIHSSVKAMVHQSLIISTCYVLWPFTAAYGAASGLYGAYEFYKYDRRWRE